MARKEPVRFDKGATIAAWLVGLILFFPILWMVLASFKTEFDAIASPPKLFFAWTSENYRSVLDDGRYLTAAGNSILVAGFSTLLALLVGLPAAWAMAFVPSRRSRSLLLWMLSTKMLPAVGVLVPVFLIYRELGLLDTRVGLIWINAIANLPLIVWMLFTYFKEIPKNILEAARMDGAGLWHELSAILLPMALPGIASTVLLNVILAWNESFWSLNLVSSEAVTLPAFIASYSSPQGLFWAKLSAASVLAITPILVLGWFSQRQLIRGLTFGAVK